MDKLKLQKKIFTENKCISDDAGGNFMNYGIIIQKIKNNKRKDRLAGLVGGCPGGPSRRDAAI